jgi:hypothetical protein
MIVWLIVSFSEQSKILIPSKSWRIRTRWDRLIRTARCAELRKVALRKNVIRPEIAIKQFIP